MFRFNDQPRFRFNYEDRFRFNNQVRFKFLKHTVVSTYKTR